MIEYFKPYLFKVDVRLTKIGMSLTRDDDFIAEFRRDDGWFLSFIAERYSGPQGEIVIIPPNIPDKFALDILMEAYQKIEAKPLPAPSLVNQIDFFTTNIDGWLSDVSKYKKTYNGLRR